MLVRALEQLVACDKRGPYRCAYCREAITLPAFFNLTPTGKAWIHSGCTSHTNDICDSEIPAADGNRFGGSRAADGKEGAAPGLGSRSTPFNLVQGGGVGKRPI